MIKDQSPVVIFGQNSLIKNKIKFTKRKKKKKLHIVKRYSQARINLTSLTSFLKCNSFLKE